MVSYSEIIIGVIILIPIAAFVGLWYGKLIGKPKTFVGDQRDETEIGRELYHGKVKLAGKSFEYVKTTGGEIILPYGSTRTLMTNVLRGKRRKKTERVIRAVPCDLETWVRLAFADQPLKRQATLFQILYYSGAMNAFNFVRPVAPLELVEDVITKEAEVADYWRQYESTVDKFENVLHDQREDDIRRTDQMISFQNISLKTLSDSYGDMFQDVLSRAPTHAEITSRLTAIEKEKLMGTSLKMLASEGGIQSAMKGMSDFHTNLQKIAGRLGARFVPEETIQMLNEYKRQVETLQKALIEKSPGESAFNRAYSWMKRRIGKE